MILYVNGDSHSAGGEAVNDYCFANDDKKYFYMGRAPHPDNLIVSYGSELSKILKAKLRCEAESASSNDRIIRTTRDFLKIPSNDRPFVIIGWSTWEREEWLHDDTYWQINAGGVGEDWPEEIKEKYKHWIVKLDIEKKKTEWHKKVWEFHEELSDLKVKHFFFNSFEALGAKKQKKWNDCYLDPYNNDSTYYNWAIKNGFKTRRANSYHFGADAHFAWSRYLIKYLTKVL